jgi:hypothetical protein
VVLVVRGGNVDDIEIVGRDKLLVVAVASLERHARGESLRSIFAPRADGDEILFGVRTHRVDESLGDPARAQDSPPHGGASLAGAIRDGGNEVGKGIERAKE